MTVFCMALSELVFLVKMSFNHTRGLFSCKIIINIYVFMLIISIIVLELPHGGIIPQV